MHTLPTSSDGVGGGKGRDEAVGGRALPRAVPQVVMVAGQELTVYEEWPALLEAMVRDIGGARERVWVETYIFYNDAGGRRFAEALKERARAGVEVRVLYDAWGSAFTPGAFFAEMEAAGVKVHAYHTLLQGLERFKPLTILNRRDHRKLLVVDDEVGYFGGMNIIDNVEAPRAGRHGRVLPGLGWRDVHVRLAGTQAREIGESFERAWRKALGKRRVEEEGEETGRRRGEEEEVGSRKRGGDVEETGRRRAEDAVKGSEKRGGNEKERGRKWGEEGEETEGKREGERGGLRGVLRGVKEGRFLWRSVWRRELKEITGEEGADGIRFFDSGGWGRLSRVPRVYARVILRARHQVTVAMAYFVPVGMVLRAFLRARRRRVGVRVIVPGVSDVAVVKHATAYLYGRLLRRGFRIYERRQRMMHSKVMIVDERWTVVGSANLDPRSLHTNLEFLAVIRSRDFARAMQRVWRFEMGHSERITLRGVRETGWWGRLVNWGAWMGRWWL